MPDTDYSVTKIQAQLPAAEFYRDYVDPPRFLACCQQCGNYKTVWSCPPYDFPVDEVWQGYQQLHLIGWRLDFSREMRARRWQPQEIEALLKSTLYRERSLMEKELLALEAAHPGSRALAPGSCHRCEEQGCTRAQNRPCRAPQFVRYSLESLGGDVSKAAANLLNSPLQWISDGQLPGYLLLVGGLLLPQNN